MSATGRSSGISYKGLKELNAFNTKLPNIFKTITLETFKKFGKMMFDDTQQKVPVRTGRLKRSGGWTVGNLFLSIFYNEHYAYHVDQGTSRFSGRHYFYKVLESYDKKIVTEINMRISKEIKTNLGKG